jgi:hypothetical protein
LTALPSLWKYYDNAKLCFAIHAPKGAIHEIKNFNSRKATPCNSSKNALAYSQRIFLVKNKNEVWCGNFEV